MCPAPEMDAHTVNVRQENPFFCYQNICMFQIAVSDFVSCESIECFLKAVENVVLRIISDEFFDFENIAVEKIKWTLHGEAKDLTQCDIGLAPLPDNNFTRGKCGFKILQYQAAALPVVASPTGVNADYTVDGRTGYHALNSQQWIERTGRLIENAQLRKQMGQEGFEHAKNFDKEVIGQHLLGLIRDCLEDDIA